MWHFIRSQILQYPEYTLEEDEIAKSWAEEEEAEEERLRTEAHQRADMFNVVLKARGLTLRDYQRDGIKWLSTRRVGLLTDEMGLGKTLQSLCSIPENVGSIIICPASLRGYWRDEIHTWRPELEPILVQGKGTFKGPESNQAVICSDSAISALSKMTDGDFDRYLMKPDLPTFLIADEAHAFKAATSARTKNMLALCSYIRRRHGWTIGLTGTPLLNNPEELFQLATVFGCQQLGWGSEPAFRRAFDMGPDMGFGPTYGKPKPEAREGLARIFTTSDACGCPARAAIRIVSIYSRTSSEVDGENTRRYS